MLVTWRPEALRAAAWVLAEVKKPATVPLEAKK
jgi:hypothetical protein